MIAKNQMRDIIHSIYKKYIGVVSLSGFFGCFKENRKILKEINEKYENIYMKMFTLESIFKTDDLDKLVDSMFCYCGKIKSIKANNCSIKCSSSSIGRKNKIKQTKLERYGDENFNNQVKNKQTCVERYGNEHYTQSDKTKKLNKERCLECYGVENVFQLTNVKEKSKQTKLERYGDENFNNQVKNKQTKLERYGDENFNNREQYKQTCLEKYGVENGFQSEEIKMLCKSTNIDKFGVENVFQRHIKNLDDLNESFVKKTFIKDGCFYLDDFCQFFDVSHSYYYRIIVDKFNITTPIKSEKHRTQNEIYQWLISLGVNVVSDTKKIIKPLELDIYLPDHNLAIEYDGLMYHSFGKNSWSALNNFEKESIFKNKHLTKTEVCENQNIQLLHIFENEWLDSHKQEIWKSVIKTKLGLNERIFARKCEIREIKKAESNDFLYNNHLQSVCASSINIGLFYENKLVSVMTFGKARYNKNYQYELLRFCSIKNLTIVGGASRLLKYFKKTHKPSSIISYANRRWSNGNLYKTLKFNELRITQPNYFYFNKKELVLGSRLKFQKHKLKNLLEVYNEELSESVNMYNNDYRKIYDCGNLVFELTSI